MLTLRRSLPARSTSTSLPYFFIGCLIDVRLFDKLPGSVADSSSVVSNCKVMMQWPRDEYSFSLVDLQHTRLLKEGKDAKCPKAFRACHKV